MNKSKESGLRCDHVLAFNKLLWTRLGNPSSFAWKAPICIRQLANFFPRLASFGTRLVQTGILALGWAV